MRCEKCNMTTAETHSWRKEDTLGVCMCNVKPGRLDMISSTFILDEEDINTMNTILLDVPTPKFIKKLNQTKSFCEGCNGEHKGLWSHDIDIDSKTLKDALYKCTYGVKDESKS